MSTTAKTLIPNKTWIVEDKGIKIGTLVREKIGYSFLRKGSKIKLNNLSEVKSKFGSEIFNDLTNIIKKKVEILSIYEFPCRTKPYNPIYDIKKKLPIYAKNLKTKGLYCAGYYIIFYSKGWVKSFCPKLVTLEKYPYQGPYKTEEEMKIALTQANKTYETT